MSKTLDNRFGAATSLYCVFAQIRRKDTPSGLTQLHTRAEGLHLEMPLSKGLLKWH